MNRQFDNRFDELFNEKFKDFGKNPPDYILDKVKASLESQSVISKIGNFYKNNLLIAGITLLIPAVIVGFFALPEKKEISSFTQINSVVVPSVTQNNTQQSPEMKKNNETSQVAVENKSNTPAARFFNEEACGLSCNVRASGSNGTWTCSNTAVTFASANTASTLVNVPAEGTYTLVWSPENASQPKENYSVKFIKQEKGERAKEIISCTNEVVLEANNSGSSGIWSAANGVQFKNTAGNKTTALYNGSGKVNMLWTSNVKCAVADTFSVIFADKADASFEIGPAKCFDSPVILTAKSKTNSRFEWDVDNGTVANIAPGSVSVTWAEGTKHKVTLRTWTKDNCFSSSSTVLERPAAIDVKLDIKAAQCDNNGSVKAVAVNSKASYQYFWMNNKKASGAFMNNLAPGKYDVVIRDNNSCSKTVAFEIPGKAAIKASFYSSNYDMNPPSTVYFLNTTDNGGVNGNSDKIKYEWDFGDGQKSDEESPSHVYSKAGNYKVSLTATNSEGCTNESAATDITIDPSKVVVPNVFSPNGDGVNDLFKVKTTSLSKFHAQIFSKKGDVVYEWFDSEKGWDGTVLKSGALAASGVYFYIVTAVGKDGKDYEEKGSVQLERE